MRDKKGFTLIELMIVVAIIGILAAVAIPKFAQMLEKAREGATKGNVGAIKSAISIYYGDNTGAWPGSLDNQFTNYMASIPAVKITHSGLSGNGLLGTINTVSIVTDSVDIAIPLTTDGWKYNKANGNVWVYNAQTDSKQNIGKPYSIYGYE